MSAGIPGTELRRTPLYDQHAALGARRAPFAGYDMPVFYRGIYEEAGSVRTACGVFDVSHMARLEFPANAETFLQNLLTCDIQALKFGTGSYALILNEEGGILDDVILYRKPAGDFLLVVNASNHEKISRWIQSRGGSAGDRTDETVMLAVQGPKAEEILSGTIGSAADLKSLPYFGCSEIRPPQPPLGKGGRQMLWISRTGYTGEDGFEIIAPADAAENLWNWLVKVGTVTPCGLGARDVLRVEAGYSLYGSDMDESVSPYDCGLGFAVSSRTDFFGAAALKTRPAVKRSIGLDAGSEPSAILRHGYPILSTGGRVGEVTSGVYSKWLSRSIGFGSIKTDVPADAPLTVAIRGKAIPVRRVSRRFVQGRVKSRV